MIFKFDQNFKNLQFDHILKNLHLLPKFENNLFLPKITQNWKIFNFDYILQFFQFFPLEKSSNLNKSHKNHIASILSKFEKTSIFTIIWKIFNFDHILKNLQIWTNFDKSSLSILIKFWKIFHFTKIWIINFYQNLKIFNLVLSLKKYCFSKIWKIINFYKNLLSLPKFEKSSVFAKIWKSPIKSSKFRKVLFFKNLKNHQFLQKSHFFFNFAKVWKFINFTKFWKIFNFDQILKNLHFLHKFWKVFNFDWIVQKSSILTKILL